MMSRVVSVVSQRQDMTWYLPIFQAVLLLSAAASCQAGLLGAGKGEGSCAAAPFRTAVEHLKWPAGCPPGAECCTEYGYCRPYAEWEYGNFRDCNGKSNGLPLPPDTIAAEAAAAGGGYPVPAPVVPVVPAAPAYAAAPAVAAPVAAYAPAPAAAYAPAPAAAYAAAPVAAPAAAYAAAPVAAYSAAPAAAYNYVPHASVAAVHAAPAAYNGYVY